MFFTEPVFIFLGLPLLVAAYRAAQHLPVQARVILLLVASLGLYAIASFRFLPLLMTCVLCNFWIGVRIANARSDRDARTALTIGVCANLALLIYFKSNGVEFGGAPSADLTLPLGISFYTITHLVYLVHCYKTRAPGSLDKLALVASYFPHLAAGPILYYGDVATQLDRDSDGVTVANLLAGISLFAIGLAKKLFIADTIAPYADVAFEIAGQGGITPIFAWMGAIAFALQLYFDFSGYSDMAVGLSLMFGIRLPINFNSPYKSASMVEFWSRWHISLSRVLRELVFVPLGGLKRSASRRYLVLIGTMIIGGAWHGTSVNYWLFGLVSGLLLCVNHAYRAWARNQGWLRNRVAMSWVYHPLTLLCILVLATIFRAPDVHVLATMLGGMGGAGYTGHAQSIPPEVLLTLRGLSLIEFSITAALFSSIVLFAPNSNEIIRPLMRIDRVAWRPRLRDGAFAGFALALALSSMTSETRFLYVNF
ncbi:hypothetical protein LDO31_15690 [Luteimonas sp. XNQY3]|nr:MBOAT family O-acyltransferase [Luteimonas sp. XNQY3]MCD9007652.1 hypothetical protein [Luteimonas sp. XNQY3]